LRQAGNAGGKKWKGSQMAKRIVHNYDNNMMAWGPDLVKRRPEITMDSRLLVFLPLEAVK
jgi:hypothetical protein